MRIYQRKKYRKTPRQWLAKASETTLKCLILVLVALAPTCVVVTAWYFVLFQNDIHFDERDQEIIMSGSLPVVSLLYALFTVIAITWVSNEYNEYKDMRMAVKTNNLEAFMLKKDEDLSPLMHVFITILALAVLSGFLGLRYSSPVSGGFCIGVITLIFSLLCLVVVEMDDPCHGIWVIKSIPDDWRDKDCKKWRQDYYFKKEVTALHVVEDEQKAS